MKRFALIVVLLACFDARAQSLETGNDLLTFCMQAARLDAMPANSILEPDNMLRAGVCIGFVRGIFDGLQAGDAISPRPPRQTSLIAVCPAPGVLSGQILRTVILWLRSNPKGLNEPASIAAMLAFHEYFPCKDRP